jgi:hypothetical protein
VTWTAADLRQRGLHRISGQMPELLNAVEQLAA